MNQTATRTGTQPADFMSHSLVARTADRFGVDATKLVATLKATCFKVKDGEATNEQMLALLVVAEQYKLNPFTRELFAFPDKQNGIVPVVSVDGWTRIANEHPMLDGIRFVYADDMVQIDDDAQKCPSWCEVHIKRKDRAEPIIVREYLDEVYRPAFKKADYKVKGPWQTHTKRFLRHKTLIQGLRIAFGFAGIYDQDEAERIVEGVVIEQTPQIERTELAFYSEEDFQKNLASWRPHLENGRMRADDIIAKVESKALMTDDQKATLRNIKPTSGETHEND